MERYSLTHLADGSLLQGLHTLVAQDRATTAELLAHIAEVDHRKLYARAGYPSMRAYCIGELHLSEDSAAKRIQAARKAREFSVLFEAVADGRLHLTAVNLLAPYLNEGTLDGLVAAATHRTRAEIELLLAERFPRYDAAEYVVATGHAPGHVGGEHAPGHVGGEHAPEHVGERSKLAPLAAGRFLVQCCIGKSTRDKLQYALELLSHRNPSGRLSAVIDLALDALIPELEKQKFAATDQPRPGRPTHSQRRISAQVKQEVWKRDGGACTFVGENGHRCGSRWMVEFDHIVEVARGGQATVANVRLLCRTHNQYRAECSFGPGHMERVKHEAALARTADREAAAGAARSAGEHRAAEAARARAEDQVRTRGRVEEVVPYLRKLGFRAEEALVRARGACEFHPEGSLEERVKSAISGSYSRPPRAAAAA